jgi:hypothetical protein
LKNLVAMPFSTLENSISKIGLSDQCDQMLS